MVRGNCDYIFLQPIYNKTQRDTIWDLEAAFMDRNDFNVLMDEVIVRENLEGNSAQDPKKTVRIMVCCDFEDSSVPQEKFYHFTPVRMDELPPFKLCHPKYWEESLQRQSLFGDNKAPTKSNLELLKDTETRLGKLGSK